MQTHVQNKLPVFSRDRPRELPSILAIFGQAMLPARPFFIHHSVPRVGSPKHCFQFYPDFIDGGSPRLREHVRWAVLSLNWKNRHVSVSYSSVGPTNIWFGRASCVRDLVMLQIPSAHCHRIAHPETSPGSSSSSSFAIAIRLKFPSTHRTTPVLLFST